MKNLYARAMGAAETTAAHARAPSGRISIPGAAGDGGPSMGMFDVIFRRMKDQVAVAIPEGGNPLEMHMTAAPSGLSGEILLAGPTGGMVEVAQMVAVARAPGSVAPGPVEGIDSAALALDFTASVADTADTVVAEASAEAVPESISPKTISPEGIAKGIAIESVLPEALRSDSVPASGPLPEIGGKSPESAPMFRGQMFTVVSEAVLEMEGQAGAGSPAVLTMETAGAGFMAERPAAAPTQEVFARDPIPLSRDFSVAEAVAEHMPLKAVPVQEAAVSLDLLSDGSLGKAVKLAADVMPKAHSSDAFSQILTSQPLEQLAAGAGIVRTEHLVDQIVHGVRMAQQEGVTEVVVHLKPDFLGRLSIHVLSDDKGMRVEIRAENEVVRQVMQDNLADLQQRLSDKGIVFDQLNVFSETGSRPQREPEPFPRAPSIMRSGRGETAVDVSAEPLPAVGVGMIDYLA